jgi:peroxiredoxin Q/BCP
MRARRSGRSGSGSPTRPRAPRAPARRSRAKTTAARPTRAGRATIAEGRPAPGFVLTDATGAQVRLDDFRGRDVVVYFYPRDHTPGCTKEACGFRDLWKEFERAGVAVVGISPDGAASHAKFAAQHRLPFPLLSDPDHHVMAQWGAWGPKTMYGRKTMGVIRSTVWVGPDGVVRRHWPRVVDAARHPAEVLEAIRSQRAGAKFG